MNMTTPPDFIDKLWREAVAEGVQPLDRFPQSGWKDLTMNFCVFIPEDPARLSTDSPRILRKEYPELSYWAFLRLEASHQGFCPCAQDIQMATMNFFEDTDKNPFIIVKKTRLVMTLKDLKGMVAKITNDKKCRAVAIDVEHHSLSSYRGFTSLIQLGTHEEIFLVDPLSLFPHLHLLNVITTNPAIVKVLHNGENDVGWLQRDFNVFIVNAFDTGKAAKLLGIPGGFSLRNVLQVEFRVQKDVAMSKCDWSQRPLTQRMKTYAVQDVRYLLPLYYTYARRISKNKEAAAELDTSVKQMLAKPFAFPPFNIEREVRRFVPSPMWDEDDPRLTLLRYVLAWRDIRSRSVDWSRPFLLPNNWVTPTVVEAYHCRTGEPIARHLNRLLGKKRIAVFTEELNELVRRVLDEQDAQQDGLRR